MLCEQATFVFCMGMFLLFVFRCSDAAGIQNLAIDFAGFPVDRFFPTKKSHKYLWEKMAFLPFFPTRRCIVSIDFHD